MSVCEGVFLRTIFSAFPASRRQNTSLYLRYDRLTLSIGTILKPRKCLLEGVDDSVSIFLPSVLSPFSPLLPVSTSPKHVCVAKVLFSYHC